MYIEKRMSVELLLKNAGLKITHARRALMQLFIDTKKPLSLKEITHELQKEAIDLSTLYRTIETFEKKKIIRSLRGPRKVILYERASMHAHHHIVCTSCDKIEEVECSHTDISRHFLEHSKKFKTLHSDSIELFGICTTCQK